QVALQRLQTERLCLFVDVDSGHDVFPGKYPDVFAEHQQVLLLMKQIGDHVVTCTDAALVQRAATHVARSATLDAEDDRSIATSDRCVGRVDRHVTRELCGTTRAEYRLPLDDVRRDGVMFGVQKPVQIAHTGLNLPER